MLRIWRRISLRQRIAVIVVLHAILLFGSLPVFLYALESQDNQMFIMPEAERVADIVAAFETTPPRAYPDLIAALDDGQMAVRRLPRLPVALDRDVDPPAIDLSGAEAEYRDALAGRPFRIEVNGTDILREIDDQPLLSRDPFRVLVALPDGTAIEIQRMAVTRIGKLANNLTGWILMVLLLDLVIIAWLVAEVTRPVDRLVRAVKHDDIEAMVIAEPREFAELGRAFHELRIRLNDMMEERTRIIAAIAHDFRTYLTRFELRSDFIEDEDERLATIRDLHEMRDLMDDALTFAHPDREEADDVGFDLATELEQAVAIRGGSGQTVRLLPGPDITVRASLPAFRRMMANLLDNAAQYAGGQCVVSWSQSDRTVLVAVEDDGPGIPTDRLKDVLEPFARLEQSRARNTGGVGLGLSIVHELAHRSGGNLRLENRAEGGLRAILQLPITPR